MRLRQIFMALVLISPLPAEDLVKVDKDEFLRHVENWAPPEYPRKSAAAQHTGVVTATVDVDAGGHVTGVNIVASPDVHMAETVKAEVGKWVFRPFVALGKPKAMESTIYIEFRLRPTEPNVIIPGLTAKPAPTVKDPYKRPSQ